MSVNRDFLTGMPDAPGPTSQSELAQLAGIFKSQYDILADIRRELLKQNPSVKCITTVPGAIGGNSLQISGTGQYKVAFNSAGKNAVVYQIKLWSTYDQTVYFNESSMGAYKDGIALQSGDVLFYDCPGGLNEAYLWIPTLSASACNINGNADTTHGSFNIYGYTIPDYERFA